MSDEPVTGLALVATQMPVAHVLLLTVLLPKVALRRTVPRAALLHARALGTSLLEQNTDRNVFVAIPSTMTILCKMTVVTCSALEIKHSSAAGLTASTSMG